MHVCKYISCLLTCVSLKFQRRMWASISILENYFNGKYNISWDIACIRCFLIFNLLFQSYFCLLFLVFSSKRHFRYSVHWTLVPQVSLHLVMWGNRVYWMTIIFCWGSDMSFIEHLWRTGICQRADNYSSC